MSKSPKSRLNKRQLVVILVVLGMIGLLARPFNHYADSRALAAVSRGNAQVDARHGLVWYRVAYLLAPHDPLILEKLAGAEIQTNNNRAALANSERAIRHGGGSAGYLLKAQALLELNQGNQAVTSANSAAKGSMDDQTRQMQIGLIYAAADDGEHLSQLISLQSASGAAERLKNLQHNHFALAQELYVSGLLNSSERILQKYPVESSQFYLLQARISLQLGSYNKKSLQESRGLLEKAVAISPERTDLRKLLQSVDNKLGDTAAAGDQGSKLKAIQDGKV